MVSTDRESPQPEWPPNSPFQALASSPRALRRYRQSRLATKETSNAVRLNHDDRANFKAGIIPKTSFDIDIDNDDDDDDEETLRLKLLAIETKLKLKKCQESSRRRAQTETACSNSLLVPLSPVKSIRAAASQPKESPPDMLTTQSFVHPSSSHTHNSSDELFNTPFPPTNSKSVAVSSFTQRLLQAKSTDAQLNEKHQRIELLRRKSRLKLPISATDSTQAVSNLTTTSTTLIPDTSTDTTLFESHSGLHLNKRHISHSTLVRYLESHAIISVSQILRLVKPPDYFAPCTPDIPSDTYIIMGILASKSSPREHKAFARVSTSSDPETQRSHCKFMILKLTDLIYDVDLYLFGGAYDQYWKLVPGSVLAILNPDILPPLPNTTAATTGRFALKLSSAEDDGASVIEIGSSRDLKWCEARKKDGQLCGDWIDGRKTSVCEFHLNLQLRKTRSGRMEINSMPYQAREGSQPKLTFARPGGGGTIKKSQTHGKYHDRELHETVYLAPPSVNRQAIMSDLRFKQGTNMATNKILTTGKGFDNFLGMASSARSSRESRNALKRRIAVSNAERNLAASLLKSPTKLYHRADDSTHVNNKLTERSETTGSVESLTAESLGLIRNANTLQKRKKAAARTSTRPQTLEITSTSLKHACLMDETPRRKRIRIDKDHHESNDEDDDLEIV